MNGQDPAEQMSAVLAGAGLDTSCAGDYRHFKGGVYRVLGSVPCRDDDTPAVLYLDASGVLNVRSHENFFSTVAGGAIRFVPLEAR